VNEQQDNDPHWHLDKRLNLGHLLTTLALATSIFVWASAIERRVSVHDAEIEILKTANKEAIALLRDELREVRNELRYLRTDLSAMNKADNGTPRQPRDVR
jgi:hypothetical protein